MKITGISSDGRGIAHIDGKTVFVSGGVTGDDIVLRITLEKNRFAEAEIAEIITPSEYRIVPKCPYFQQCGGCNTAHMDYEYELRTKAENIEQTMRRIGGFKDFKLDSIESGADKRYRNKAVYKVSGSNCGFYSAKSHDVINIDDCLLCNESDGNIIKAIKKYTKTENDDINELFIRHGKTAMVSLYCSKKPKNTDKLLKYITSADENVSSVIVNTPQKAYVVFGDEFIKADLLGINFRISEKSFFQVNSLMTEVLYRKTLDYASITENDNVLDIYCGIGTISLCAAKLARSVIGVEIVPQAIENAKYNAKENKIKNVEFYASSAEKIVPKLIEKESKPDIVILDPPRKGSDKNTLSAILSSSPKRIVYVSCNPATLARDARILADGGYKISSACAVDMFPRTFHVETIVLLQRQDM